MALTAFNSRLGTSQGRVAAPAGFGTGAHVFVLGDAEPGWTARLNPGDHAEAMQLVDLTEADLVRVRLRLRVPASLSPELAWQVSLTVDGEAHATARGRPGRTRNFGDLAANVSKLAGVHQVGVRLTLVEA